jgi:hypothetical protein
MISQTVAACVGGLAQIEYATCDSNGDNVTMLQANYTCNEGYFKVGAPVYCQGMQVGGRCFLLHTLGNPDMCFTPTPPSVHRGHF